jgi:hypothetical protein
MSNINDTGSINGTGSMNDTGSLYHVGVVAACTACDDTLLYLKFTIFGNFVK